MSKVCENDLTAQKQRHRKLGRAYTIFKKGLIGNNWHFPKDYRSTFWKPKANLKISPLDDDESELKPRTKERVVTC